MILIKKMRTRTGIIFGFSLLLVLMLVITFFGLRTLRRIDNSYKYLLEFPYTRYIIALELGTHFMDARRTMNRAAMYIHDAYNPEEEIAEQEMILIELRQTIDELFADYRANFAADSIIDEEHRERGLAAIAGYEREVHHYFDYYIERLLRAAHEHREIDAINYVRAGMSTVDRAMDYYNEMYYMLHGLVESRRYDIEASASNAFWSMHVLAITAVLLSATAAIVISTAVTKPTRKVALALNTLAAGGFNIEISEADATNIESAMLIRDMLKLTDTIKCINADISELIVAAADNGDLHHIICTNKYTGEWRNMVAGLNRIAEVVDAPIVEIRDVMGDLSRGHFGHKVQGDYKGDFLHIKDSVNETIDSLIGYVENELKRERTLHDISHELERKKLMESFNERVRIMFEAAPIMIEFWDNDFALLDCNQATLNYYGATSKVQFIKNHPELAESSGENAVSWQLHLSRIFQEGNGHFEFIQIKPCGEKCHLTVEAVRTNIDGADIIVTYATDVTEIKKLQQEQHILKVVEESSRAKSDFLARMSHEIRTPITAVMGISEIQLHNQNLPTAIEESFAQIYSSADSLLSLVNDILDLSKIEAGKMELLQEKYETASFIVDITHMHLANNTDENIKFILNVSENLPLHMVGDVLRIAQITNNLLSNAFKYTSAGSIEISFACREAIKPNQPVTLIITIKDTGLGMTQEQLAMLSMDYTRFHERENRFISGTGLGVPIVFNLANLMNAHIEFASMVGKGTQVTISIPQTIDSIETLGKHTARRLEKFQENSMRMKKRLTLKPEPMSYGSVLVVDDVGANIYVARGLLALYDLNITTCESGYDALELVHSGNAYDIIFMDYMMPGMSGIETLHKLRAMGYTAPIVALTANAMIGQAEEFIKEGFDGFISKPIQTPQLHNILHKFIKDKQPPEVIAAAIENASVAQRKVSVLGNDSAQQSMFSKEDELLTTLRTDFKQNHANTLDKIMNALAANDTETALLHAHTLKGLAGLIHESTLAKAAETMEHFLRNGNTAPSGLPSQGGNTTIAPAKSIDSLPSEILEGYMKTLADEISKVLDSIELSPAEPLGFGIVTSLDKDSARDLFDKLEPLLAARNMDSQSLLDDIKKVPETAVLARQIQDFDFKQAAETLKVLRLVLGC